VAVLAVNLPKLLKNATKSVKARNHELFAETPPKRSKYGAERTEYNGVTYDSKQEAMKAAELDLELRAGLIAGWGRQVEFVLPGGVKAKIDFIVFHHDETYELIDPKGHLTPQSRDKLKQIEAVHGQRVKLERRS
jgi:hypothetical protein